MVKHIDHFRFDLAANELYDFIWHHYCDWYLELSKPVLWDDAAPADIKKGTRRTLVRVLDSILRLAHPIMPYITEEIWQSISPLAGQTGETIMLAPYPAETPSLRDMAAEEDIAWLQAVILGVRNIRGEMNISPATAIPVIFKDGDDKDRSRFKTMETLLTKLTKLASATWLSPDEKAPVSATALVGKLEILVPMAGLIDVSAEVGRLTKEIAKLDIEMSKTRGKLSNEAFVNKAPESVVESERKKLADAESAATRLRRQLAEIESM